MLLYGLASASRNCVKLPSATPVSGAYWRAWLKRRGKMSAVERNDFWDRLGTRLPSWIKIIGRALVRLWSWIWTAIKGVGRLLRRFGSWSWVAIKVVGRTVKRLRPIVPVAIVAILAAATIEAVVWLHSAARKSPDAWPTSVAAGTTATLALVTLWYAYLTHRLLEAQRLAPRTAGWETALRDLSLYLNKERSVLWSASNFFPVDRPNADPPDLMDLADTLNAFTRFRDHLLEILGLLPRRFAVKVLPLTARLVDAETEIHALFQAMVEASEARRAAGHTTWTWNDVQQAHEASNDPERSEAWVDIARGRYFHAAEENWEELSTDVDNYLVGG